MNDSTKTKALAFGHLLAGVDMYDPVQNEEGHRTAVATGDKIAAALLAVLSTMGDKEHEPHDAAFLSWAKNDAENDAWRADALKSQALRKIVTAARAVLVAAEPRRKSLGLYIAADDVALRDSLDALAALPGVSP